MWKKPQPYFTTADKIIFQLYTNDGERYLHKYQLVGWSCRWCAKIHNDWHVGGSVIISWRFNLVINRWKRLATSLLYPSMTYLLKLNCYCVHKIVHQLYFSLWICVVAFFLSSVSTFKQMKNEWHFINNFSPQANTIHKLKSTSLHQMK